MFPTSSSLSPKQNITYSLHSFFNSNIRIASTQWSLKSSFILDIAAFLVQLNLVMALALAVGMPLFAAVVVSAMIVPTLFQSIALLDEIMKEFFCSTTSNEYTTTNQPAI